MIKKSYTLPNDINKNYRSSHNKMNPLHSFVDIHLKKLWGTEHGDAEKKKYFFKVFIYSEVLKHKTTQNYINVLLL